VDSRVTDHFFIMKVSFDFKSERGPYTRYFTFSRCNPRDKDYDVLIGSCDVINAFLGFKDELDEDGFVVKLKGMFILHGPKAYADQLITFFPNFLLVAMEPDMHDSFNSHNDFTFIGEHPYARIRKRLFSDEAPIVPKRSVTPKRGRDGTLKD
jgi:hypothetical protein